MSFAQSLHRLDMRLRLGLLQDQAAIERQLAHEAKARKPKTDNIPTVKTEAQTKADEAALDKAERADKPDKERKRAPPKIRPLSEAKAIDSGANFISEGFLFSVGLGLIVFETWRSRRKENSRRSDIADQIAALESKVETMDSQLSELQRLGPNSALWQKWHGTGSGEGAADQTREKALSASKAEDKSVVDKREQQKPTDSRTATGSTKHSKEEGK